MNQLQGVIWLARCGWRGGVHFFCLDTKETEPKKKSRLHLFGGYTPSFTKAQELAALKQLALFYAHSVITLFHQTTEADNNPIINAKRQ